MGCLHPGCLLGTSGEGWADAVERLGRNVQLKPSQRESLLANLQKLGVPGDGLIDLSTLGQTAKRELLNAAPCLYTQTHERRSSAGVVHLAEGTMGKEVTASNVVRAFEI